MSALHLHAAWVLRHTGYLSEAVNLTGLVTCHNGQSNHGACEALPLPSVILPQGRLAAVLLTSVGKFEAAFLIQDLTPNLSIKAGNQAACEPLTAFLYSDWLLLDSLLVWQVCIEADPGFLELCFVSCVTCNQASWAEVLVSASMAYCSRRRRQFCCSYAVFTASPSSTGSAGKSVRAYLPVHRLLAAVLWSAAGKPVKAPCNKAVTVQQQHEQRAGTKLKCSCCSQCSVMLSTSDDSSLGDESDACQS